MGLLDFFKKNKKEEKIEAGLEKTKTSLFGKLRKSLLGRKEIDEALLDELEEILITADIGVDTTVKIIERLRERVRKEKYNSAEEVIGFLKEEIAELFKEKQAVYDESTWETDKKPYVILVVGVNGVGKTTTIGKLAYQFKQAGKKVLLGAADTFRAAAVNQLKIWGERVGVPVTDKGQGADPAAVAYSTMEKAVNENFDVVLIDTAGRLHNKKHLMNELAKIKRVIQKHIPDAPHEILLVLDASTGQNAVQQAEEFLKTTDITAIALTKLDGTAKGGVVISISDKFGIPIKYIGVGEQMLDLQLFDPKLYVESLFK